MFDMLIIVFTSTSMITMLYPLHWLVRLIKNVVSSSNKLFAQEILV